MIYAENPKVLVKNKNEVILDFNGTKIAIHEGDFACMLIDPLFGALNYNKPSIIVLSFYSLYDDINGVDDSGDYEFDSPLAYLHGISVSHHWAA